MIGFSIIMWFVSIILLIVAITLLKGKTSTIHGKVYEETQDKEGYAKSSGRIVLFMAIGIAACGGAALIGTQEQGLLYAVILLAVIILIAALFFYKIQKKYGKRSK